MKKLYSNHWSIALLAVAFLTLQWSSTHIHVSGSHNHGGEEHHHKALAHQHHAHHDHDYHPGSLDVAQDLFGDLVSHDSHHDSEAVVELSYDCTTCYSKVLAKPVSLFSPGIMLATGSRLVVGRLHYSSVDVYKKHFHYISPAVRAPPMQA